MSNRPLSVAIDLSALPPEIGGVGRYASELSRALAARDDVELVLVERRGTRRRAVNTSDRSEPRVLGVAPNGRVGRLLFEELALAPALSVLAHDVGVVHSPHYTTPRSRRLGVVTTVHDLTFIDHPEWHERSKAAYFAYAIRRAASAADVVVCVSQHTADRLSELFSPRARIHVAPHGVDHERFRADEPIAGADDAVLASLSINRPYVLHLGTIEPRKNLPLLVRAFDRLEDDELSLVLAGRLGWGDTELERALGESPKRDRIIRLGYVEDAVVPPLLRRCALVAYPSSAEGFGLPALEALACGAPLVTTAGTVMAEFANEAALLVEAGSLDELVAAMEAVLSGDGVDERRARGICEAAQFTWANSAEAHVHAYRDALSR